MAPVEGAQRRVTHLALTGLRDLWPAGDPVWLVSPACVPRPFIEVSDPRIAGVLPYPWQQSDLPAVHSEARVRREMLLGFLSDRLNQVHGVSYSHAYWRRVVGPWLFFYVNLVSHHYATLRQALTELGKVVCIGLDHSRYLMPSNTLEFLHDATDDAYNLQVYTRIASAIGIPIIEYRAPAVSRIADTPNPEGLPRRRAALSERIAARLLRDLRRTGNAILGPKAEIIMRRSFLPEWFELRLLLAMRGSAWAHHGDMYRPPRMERQPDVRRSVLAGAKAGSDVLGGLLASFIIDDLPTVFLEGYAGLAAFSEREYGRYRPSVVLSTASWETDEAFGHFAGLAADSGARLVGGECSAIYGIEQDSQMLEFERSHVDLYLTWGWTDPDYPRCIPTTANRLIGVHRRAPRPTGDGILYVGTVAFRFPVIARPDFSAYFELQRRFFASLDPAMRAEFRVRLHATDYGWGIERRLKAVFPDLMVDRWERDFPEALRAARMYVCDHYSTTWAVALASNIPSVIFWDPVFTPVRPEMQPIFDQAREARIVHDTPEAAAEWVAHVYRRPEDWWFSDATQRALREFRFHVACVSENPLADWMGLLRGLLKRGEDPGTHLTGLATRSAS